MSSAMQEGDDRSNHTERPIRTQRYDKASVLTMFLTKLILDALIAGIVMKFTDSQERTFWIVFLGLQGVALYLSVRGMLGDWIICKRAAKSSCWLRLG
jgi:hypothetical protein